MYIIIDAISAGDAYITCIYCHACTMYHVDDPIDRKEDMKSRTGLLMSVTNHANSHFSSM